MFDERDLETLYKKIGQSRDYTIGDLVVVEIDPGDFWIGEVWADSIDPTYVRIKYGVYGSGEARNCVRKEFIRPATASEQAEYTQLKEKRGR
jgi:hypothetical protein